MAIISKIREKSGLAVGIVALGLMFFIVGGDILGPNSVLLGRNKMEVGEIAGETIKREEYQVQIDELKYNYTLNYGRNPIESEMYTIRQQAWDFLFVKIAFQNEFDEVGLLVTDEEIVDMVQGNNIHRDLQQAFTNPETGIFERDQIVAYLQNISQLPPQQQAGWYMFESNLSPSRLRLKYDNMLVKTTFVTEEETKQQYRQENTIAEVKYLYVPYYTVDDSLINFTESDLKEYLSKNKNDYMVEESRSLSYITFPITPSREDTLYYQVEMEDLKKEFEAVEDDSIFARINTDGRNSFGTLNIGTLPVKLRDQYTELEKGQVIGPEREGGNLVLYKISDAFEDSIYYVRASHILFRATDVNLEQKEEARKKARELLRDIRNGADFALMARENSEDGSASAGGDLGWFDENRMVKPFSNAVFLATSEGLINRVIESEFGFHLIKVTGLKTKNVFKVATIEREITPSDFTRDGAFREADYFASRCVNFKEFENNAALDSLTILDVQDLDKNDRRISGMGEARSIIRWIYTDASVGEVSDVFELDNQYVVAVLTETVNEGIANLDDVRLQLETKVKNQFKGVFIIEKLNGLEGTLDEIAETYGDVARIYSSSDLKQTTNSLPGVGFAPSSIGTVFSMNDGERTQPIKENDGVVIIELEALTNAPEIADYTQYANPIEQRRNSRISFLISEAIRDNANIVDERYRFF